MKKQNGITLITLIITILIMLLLAYIAISAITDFNILSQTEDAASRVNQLAQNTNQLINELNNPSGSSGGDEVGGSSGDNSEYPPSGFLCEHLSTYVSYEQNTDSYYEPTTYHVEITTCNECNRETRNYRDPHEPGSDRSYTSINESIHFIRAVCKECNGDIINREEHNTYVSGYEQNTDSYYEPTTYHVKVRTCNNCDREIRDYKDPHVYRTYSYYENSDAHFVTKEGIYLRCVYCGYQSDSIVHNFSEIIYEEIEGDDWHHTVKIKCDLHTDCYMEADDNILDKLGIHKEHSYYFGYTYSNGRCSDCGHVCDHKDGDSNTSYCSYCKWTSGGNGYWDDNYYGDDYWDDDDNNGGNNDYYGDNGDDSTGNGGTGNGGTGDGYYDTGNDGTGDDNSECNNCSKGFHTNTESIIKAATCTNSGQYKLVCNCSCGCSWKSAIFTTSATGHNWSLWGYYKRTATTHIMYRQCINCSEEEKQAETGHTWEYNGIRMYCPVCGYEKY